MATSHICHEKSAFHTYIETPRHVVKRLGGIDVPAVGRGSINVLFNVDGREVPITLQEVLHAPTLSHNLISLSRVTDAGFEVTLKGGELSVFARRGKEIASGRKVDRLYQMDMRIADRDPDRALSATKARTWEEWHRIFGHMHMGTVKALKTKNMVECYEKLCSPPQKLLPLFLDPFHNLDHMTTSVSQDHMLSRSV